MRKLTTLFLFAVSLVATAQTHVMDVNTNKLGAPVQPTMYGIFFEDINYAADGGLYAEMVKNRSFEFPQHLMGWRAFGNFDVEDEGGPFDRNPHYVRQRQVHRPGERRFLRHRRHEGSLLPLLPLGPLS